MHTLANGRFLVAAVTLLVVAPWSRAEESFREDFVPDPTTCWYADSGNNRQARYDRGDGILEVFTSREAATPAWRARLSMWTGDVVAPKVVLVDADHVVLVRGESGHVELDDVVIAVRSRGDVPIDVRIRALLSIGGWIKDRSKANTLQWTPDVLEGVSEDVLSLRLDAKVDVTIEHRTGVLYQGKPKRTQPSISLSGSTGCLAQRADLDTPLRWSCDDITIQGPTRGALPGCNLCAFVDTMTMSSSLFDGSKHEMEFGGRRLELTFKSFQDSDLSSSERVQCKTLRSLHDVLSFPGEALMGEMVGRGVARSAADSTKTTNVLADAFPDGNSIAVAIGSEIYGLIPATRCFVGSVASDEMVVYRADEHATLRTRDGRVMKW